ncbi:MAG: MmcQ/YjbR family DNA-binding protein [Anaerolineae bacterium]|nr:MmcQ/YjbR family DNA-binding protein [Anaerolineae bacterium]
MSEEVLNKLRAICLALPEATEQGGVGDPTFKVRDKIFAMRHPVNGRWSMWCKAAPGFQEMLVGSEPDRYFVPPYVGQHGWIGAWLDIELDWDFLAHLISESYRITAPKRLIALINEQRGKDKS